MQLSHVTTPSRPTRGRRERGASLVEYALLVALIAVVCIASVTFLGKSSGTKFNKAGNAIGDKTILCAPGSDPNTHWNDTVNPDGSITLGTSLQAGACP